MNTDAIAEIAEDILHELRAIRQLLEDQQQRDPATAAAELAEMAKLAKDPAEFVRKELEARKP